MTVRNVAVRIWSISAGYYAKRLLI